MVRCGELACQKDSYLRELSATVVSCKPRAALPATKGKADKKKTAEENLFDIVLSDTVLFPEGWCSVSETSPHIYPSLICSSLP